MGIKSVTHIMCIRNFNYSLSVSTNIAQPDYSLLKKSNYTISGLNLVSLKMYGGGYISYIDSLF